ncbi:uncharacterized protein EV422DRAFT_548244 [Fimicolochytrium jonesii]|uniref:uncharacterized protein n=1 Tax=Fimicolochytrium jonesii TaxID=1396493 RepID=UPI0022FF251A|nr:uncharacterized protein EV422DRAFT_548244 [Fimicolochytrium jonesii]KAI8815749.1 hypothetical protein EV422DRAFT_548244 [Fimicolochytrium jonesii]
MASRCGARSSAAGCLFSGIRKRMGMAVRDQPPPTTGGPGTRPPPPTHFLRNFLILAVLLIAALLIVRRWRQRKRGRQARSPSSMGTPSHPLAQLYAVFTSGGGVRDVFTWAWWSRSRRSSVGGYDLLDGQFGFEEEFVDLEGLGGGDFAGDVGRRLAPYKGVKLRGGGAGGPAGGSSPINPSAAGVPRLAKSNRALSPSQTGTGARAVSPKRDAAAGPSSAAAADDDDAEDLFRWAETNLPPPSPAR